MKWEFSEPEIKKKLAIFEGHSFTKSPRVIDRTDSTLGTVSEHQCHTPSKEKRRFL